MAKNKPFKKLPVKNTSNFKIDTPPNYDDRKPAFSFREMKYRGDGCLSVCEDRHKVEIADRLVRLSQLPWKEIYKQPKEGLGFENIPCRQFIIPLPATITQEMETLVVFRFSDSGRMAGFRSQDTYHIVVVGPNHSLYR